MGSTTTSRWRRRSRPEDLAAFETEMRKVMAEKLPFVRAEVSRDDGEVGLCRRSAQARADRRPRPRRDHLDLHRRSVRRSLPRTARATHRLAQALQAAECRGGILARRLQPADAAAHLRHGVLEEGRAGRSTCTASRKRRSATIAASARSSICSCSTRSRRARRSGPNAARP